MNDELKEKLKFKIAISEMKDKEGIAMEEHKFNWKKLVRIAACLVIGMTGIAYATNLGNIREKITNNRGLGQGVETAAKNGYIADTNMDYVEQTTAIKSQETILDNVDVQVKIDNFLMDDRNISLEFVFLFGENIDEYVDFDNIHNVDFSTVGAENLKIIDEENRYVNEGSGWQVFPATIDKEHHRINLMYDIYGSDFPKSKELHISFSQIVITEEAEQIKDRKETILTGDWNIDLEVPEIMYNRTNEYYEVVSCDSKDFNIYSSFVNETGFEIGVIVSNTRKSKEEIDKEAKEFHDAYDQKIDEIYKKYGIDENSSSDDTMKANAEASKEVNSLFMKLDLDYKVIDTHGEYFKIEKSISGDYDSNTKYPDTRSYVENSNGERFYCTNSPGRKQDGNYLEGNKWSYYETFDMTKYDCTDKIKVVLYYYGEPVIIELEKVK